MIKPSTIFPSDTLWDLKPLPLFLVPFRAIRVLFILLVAHALNALRLFMSVEWGWRWRGKVFRMWARETASALGMRVKVHGDLPEAPYLIASNHLSYVDIIAIATQLDAVFIAKNEILGWPLLGNIVRGFDSLFVERGDPKDLIRVNRAMSHALESGKGIVFFPEGTSTAGSDVLPFQPPLFHSAAAAGHPVHYLTIFYKTPRSAPPASRAVCWWGDMEFVSHLKDLLKIRTFTCCLAFGPRPIVSSRRKDLASNVWRAAREQFVAVA